MSIIPTNTFHNLKYDKKFKITEAAIDEFSQHSFKDANVSTIIKAAGIPRGSFYQYFEDKLDLYNYLFTKIAERKLDYMKDLLPNPDEMSFLDLFEEMYKRGARFAVENPRYVMITAHLLKTRDELYNQLVGGNMDVAKDYYIGYIEADKEKGRIDPLVDSEALANLVIELTTNVAIDQMALYGVKLQEDKMIEQIQKIIYIFKKGIQVGE